MDEKAVKKLKSKFVLVASLSFLVVMLFISGFIYLFNYMITRSDAENALDYIIENGGSLPTKSSESTSSASVVENIFYLGRSFVPAEFGYSTRYFSVIFDENEDVKEIKTGHIAAVSAEEAVNYCRQIYKGRMSFGRLGNYFFKKQAQEDGTTIVAFVDWTEQLLTEKRLLNFVLILIGFGMLVSILVMRLLASRVVKVEIRNIENQRTFITNASHELKTPLAVIKANTEITELTAGETEWTQSTLRQVDRMTGLIQNLVMITRAQEKSGGGELVSFDAGRAVKETADTFAAVASQDGKELQLEIQEGVNMRGEEADIRQLTSLLVDNAIKYCDEKGTIRVKLIKRGRNGVKLTVSNNYAEGKNVDYTRFFERFYREDKSHNQDKGGYGIGLSIAENICEKYRGVIRANWMDGVISFTCLLN